MRIVKWRDLAPRAHTHPPQEVPRSTIQITLALTMIDARE
jgi:hypothetical protein